MNKRELEIKVPVLARVEGEGSLELLIEGEELREAKLSIFEPPRLFEKFLEGRHYTEVPDLVARICGICPVAYQMSAVHALEGLFDTRISEWIRAMRRVYYCGEWIESHALHIHLLALPDFLGYQSAPEMAKDHPLAVKRGLRIQALGNDLIKLFGGRSVNPVGAEVGGFSGAPTKKEVNTLYSRLDQCIDESAELLEWLLTFSLPESNQDFPGVSLRHEYEYPMNEGRLASSDGLNIPVDAFENHFVERQVPHSTAFQCYRDDKAYLVGPLARCVLNSQHLNKQVKTILDAAKLKLNVGNSYHSLIARAMEILHAASEAKDLLRNYVKPNTTREKIITKAGVAIAATEAPRGTLWHRYEIDADGLVCKARIVPPTSQNQARIEADLRHALTTLGLYRPEEELRFQAEQIIRNYDPCISCATHFLDLRVNRQ
ncbi:MAG: nickel-dependent hydrogenase large subunit [Gammaproteobacteria bacterium]|nr:nickel-dependent hydrogenase large subunit [Gammaproteobacteria bacterium]MDH5691999.1 nickel-dependent hydrogenase large subunit [Gammaproteobacteria bacterium]